MAESDFGTELDKDQFLEHLKAVDASPFYPDEFEQDGNRTIETWDAWCATITRVSGPDGAKFYTDA